MVTSRRRDRVARHLCRRRGQRIPALPALRRGPPPRDWPLREEVRGPVEIEEPETRRVERRVEPGHG